MEGERFRWYSDGGMFVEMDRGGGGGGGGRF